MADIGRSVAEGKARGRLMAFIGVMGVALVWLYFQDHTPVVRTDQATAVVLAVKEAGWQVKLGTGETLWIAAFPGITVKEGETIPVRIEVQESGTRRVRLDRERWIEGG